MTRSPTPSAKSVSVTAAPTETIRDESMSRLAVVNPARARDGTTTVITASVTAALRIV
jgi:hypothetical protein